jgi:hypothetical protein
MQTDNTIDVLSSRVRILERKIQSLEKALEPARSKIIHLNVWLGSLSLVAVVLWTKIFWQL